MEDNNTCLVSSNPMISSFKSDSDFQADIENSRTSVLDKNASVLVWRKHKTDEKFFFSIFTDLLNPAFIIGMYELNRDIDLRFPTKVTDYVTSHNLSCNEALFFLF
ncbi:hypothetical protein CDAR_537411 [Caerostris darwini]|uniref:PiggyBac transposable element-derived protein domain-containing protein n=1 Tax=Caerostris darwini TaxID=1538125 RepID=A0AAV4QAL7_9ARAC|nr:hypothetical protein CDAR_537411 [Caerostris darwini]